MGQDRSIRGELEELEVELSELRSELCSVEREGNEAKKAQLEQNMFWVEGRIEGLEELILDAERQAENALEWELEQRHEIL